MTDPTIQCLQGDALNLTMVEDETVDLVVTSPPYFALRVYKDAGRELNVVGNEETPDEYLKTLDRWMEEMWRVLKPEGSIFVVLGDKYAGGGGQWEKDERPDPHRRRAVTGKVPTYGKTWGVTAKSLIGLPWRFAINQIDAGWILRQEVVWSKPNAMPESVVDRCRRAHETIFHFTKQGKYYSAVDRVREPYATATADKYKKGSSLGKLPGSVWDISTSGLTIPKAIIEQFETDKHFAAFPPEIPLKIVQGWSPEGICANCGQGRVPVSEKGEPELRAWSKRGAQYVGGNQYGTTLKHAVPRTVVGEKCGCEEPTAPTTPALVLDPFGGAGTTALVAKVLGRSAISVDISAGYTRLAIWRTMLSDHGEKLMAKWEKKGLIHAPAS